MGYIMVISESSDSAGKKTVNVAESIDKITELIQEAKCIMGDDFTQIAKLKSARGLLINLIDGLCDSETEVTYFSGSMDEFGNLR